MSVPLLGGRVAEVVGRKLYALGSAFQVLCITHLPQVAAYADGELDALAPLKRVEVHDAIQAGPVKEVVDPILCGDEPGN